MYGGWGYGGGGGYQDNDVVINNYNITNVENDNTNVDNDMTAFDDYDASYDY